LWITIQVYNGATVRLDAGKALLGGHTTRRRGLSRNRISLQAHTCLVLTAS